MIFSDKERQAPTKTLEAEPSHLARYNFVLEFIKNTDKVLDIPCGSGYGSNVISNKAKKVVGVDICSEAINHAKEFFQRDNIEFKIADMDNLEKNNFYHDYDVVVSFEGIEHINKQEFFLESIKRLIKKGGCFIISTPRKPHGSPYHTIEFSLKEFEDILSKYFIIEKMFGQIYTDIFNMEEILVNPDDYKRFNFIAVCTPKLN